MYLTVSKALTSLFSFTVDWPLNETLHPPSSPTFYLSTQWTSSIVFPKRDRRAAHWSLLAEKPCRKRNGTLYEAWRAMTLLSLEEDPEATSLLSKRHSWVKRRVVPDLGEKKRGALGGTCLNVGCIPSKAMLNNSHIYHQTLHDIKSRGIDVDGVSLNLPNMLKAKDTSVTGLTKGVEGLFKKYKVDYIKGTGSFVSANKLKVDLLEGGEEQIEAKNVIIATGSDAMAFPGVPFDEERIVSSTGALSLQEVPKKLTVIGGGVIGLELGSVWSRLGAEVTVVEFMSGIGGVGIDEEIAKSFQKILTKQGFKFKLNTKVTSLKREGDVVTIEVEGAKDGKKETLTSDVVLVAIGRRPYTDGLNLEAIG
ncbi:hypothetical protein M408DRAFT_27473, partial [Serendipita vermifera MAFF 305830]